MAQVPTKRNQSSGMTTHRHAHPLERFRRQFDSLLDRLWSGWSSLPVPFEEDFDEMTGWDFDVKEEDKEIVVRAEMPGFEDNELDVRLENNVLTIKAEKEQKEEGHEEYRHFYRTVILPSGIDAEKVQASYRNGVLEMHIPRPEGAQAKRIAVQTHPGSQGEKAAASASKPETQATAQAAKTKAKQS